MTHAIKQIVDTSPQEQPVGSKEIWKIEITGSQYVFSKEVNGRSDESYAPVGKEKAAVFAVSIIQGFQPPRDLRNYDTQAG